MYSRVFSEKRSGTINFQVVDGNLYLVIATTAFGMVIDCQDILRVTATLKYYHF